MQPSASWRSPGGGRARRHHLTFTFEREDGTAGVALYRETDRSRPTDREYARLAETVGDVPAHDWATLCGDDRTVVVWGDVLDVYELDGERLVLRGSHGAGFVKAFPVAGHGAHFAARMIHPSGREAVLHDGRIGELWDRVRDPVFFGWGAHLAYEARLDGERFLVVDGHPYGPFGPFETTAFDVTARDARIPLLETRTWGGDDEHVEVFEAGDPLARDARVLRPRVDRPQGPFLNR